MTGVVVGGLPGMPNALAGQAGLAFLDIVQALLALPTGAPVQARLVSELLSGKPETLPLAVSEDAEPADDVPQSAAEVIAGQSVASPALAALFLPAAPSGGLAMRAGGDAAEIAIGRQNLPAGVARQPEPALAGMLAPRQETGPVLPEALAALPAVDLDTLPEAAPTIPPERVLEALSRASQTAQTAQLAVATPVAAREWATDFSQRVLWMAGQRVQFAEIAVNPPNLGGVEVRLSMQDQGAGAQFFAASATVRDALEAALPRLRDMLAEAGISLLQAEVRDQAFADRQAWQAGQAAGADGSGPVHVLPVHVARGLGLIDLYA